VEKLKIPKKNSMNAIEMSEIWKLETDVEKLRSRSTKYIP
jgi:hypothetical protein